MTRRIFAALIVTGLGAIAPLIGGWFHPDVHFNYGPGDHAYLEGYEPRWEIDPDGTATHWSTYESNVRLPLRFDGSRFELTYRFSRVYGETAQVELRVNGVPADRFSARGGAYLERSVVIPGSVLSAQTLDLELAVDSHERQNRGLRMDWFRLRAEDRRGRAVPDGAILLGSALLSLAFWLLAHASLRDLRWSLALRSPALASRWLRCASSHGRASRARLYCRSFLSSRFSSARGGCFRARIHKVSATQLPDEVTWNVPRFLKQPRMGTR